VSRGSRIQHGARDLGVVSGYSNVITYLSLRTTLLGEQSRRRPQPTRNGEGVRQPAASRETGLKGASVLALARMVRRPAQPEPNRSAGFSPLQLASVPTRGQTPKRSTYAKRSGLKSALRKLRGARGFSPIVIPRITAANQVAQVSNLPYRGFPIRERRASPMVCRLGSAIQPSAAKPQPNRTAAFQAAAAGIRHVVQDFPTPWAFLTRCGQNGRDLENRRGLRRC